MPRLAVHRADAAPDLPADSPPGEADRRQAAPLPPLMPARQAADLYAVSPATWHRWVAAGRVPAPVRIGATVRWRRSELEAHIAAGCPDRRTWEALRRGH